MRTRTFITGLVSLPINAVLFGLGAIVVLSIPALSAHAVYLLPAIIIASVALTVPLAWKLAPALRARNHYPKLNRKW